MAMNAETGLTREAILSRAIGSTKGRLEKWLQANVVEEQRRRIHIAEMEAELHELRQRSATV